MPTLLLLNPQIYQALRSVIMNHRVHCFHDLIYFYRIKAMSLITFDHLQWTIYVKAKSRVYMCIKKTSAKFSRPSSPSSGKWKCISFIFVFYPFSFTSQRYPNIAVAVKDLHKGRFFNVHQSFLPPKVIRILMKIMNII